MPRKLTPEQFMEKFYKQNKHAQDIELLETYTKTQNKIKCRCKKCGYEWNVLPSSLLQGHGCNKCEGKRTAKGQAKTHKQFMEDFKTMNEHAQDIEILGTYKNNYTKIKCKCKIDGYEWEAKPNSLLGGSGCAKCAGMVKLTQEQFITKLHQVNPDIEVVGTYVNTHTKIKCKCRKDGYEWEAAPNSLLKGYGCPECAGIVKPTQAEFIAKVKQLNPDIEVLGTYVNAQTKIKFRCKIDGYEWEAIPNNLLRGHGCPKCGGKLMPTTEEFKEKLHKINPDIEVLGTYKMSLKKIQCKCKKCGHEWKTLPNSLLQGTGCPKCKTTKGEKRIAQYLDNLDIHYIYNKQYFSDLYSIGGGLMRPDFIIPSLKIWIEYDGEQHFKPVDFTGAMSVEEVQQLFKYTQQNDKIKDQYAKANNWILVRIPFTEYDNIEQILAAYLKQEQAV